jgi:hypothetical protein
MKAGFLNICILTILICFCGDLSGQKVLLPKQVDVDWKGIVYKKEKSFDFRWHENGFAIGYNSGKLRTYYKTNYYNIEIGYTKDFREKRQNKNFAVSVFNNSRSYVYGKVNSLINLRAGFGTKKYLSEKARRKGLAIGYNLEAGPSIAVLKPYFLDLIYVTEDGGPFEVRSESYSEDNAEVFLNENSIFGSSGFFRGFTDLSIVPGLQGKAGLHFAVGAFDKYVKAMEVGLAGDLFIKKIPILLETDAISNKPYFVKFYLKMELGYRTN